MDKRIVTMTASAFALLCAMSSAGAQSTGTQPSAQPQPPTSLGGPGTMGQGMTRQGGMMGGVGMMDRGRVGRGRGTGAVLRVIFALMDSDGDGTVSLQEFQAAHERIFKAMDANKDGVLTLQEMQAFLSGQTSEPARSGPQQ
jgi:hypothetical protein